MECLQGLKHQERITRAGLWSVKTVMWKTEQCTFSLNVYCIENFRWQLCYHGNEQFGVTFLKVISVLCQWFTTKWLHQGWHTINVYKASLLIIYLAMFICSGGPVHHPTKGWYSGRCPDFATDTLLHFTGFGVVNFFMFLCRLTCWDFLGSWMRLRILKVFPNDCLVCSYVSILSLQRRGLSELIDQWEGEGILRAKWYRVRGSHSFQSSK